MKRRIAISGMGRIGRLLVRRAFTEGLAEAEIVAINTTSPAETVAHLLKYDTVHGKWKADFAIDNQYLIINGHPIEIVTERDPLQLPWERLGIHIAIDATGKFNDRQGASKHLAAGAERVIITAPGSGVDLTVVMGVNEACYDPREHKVLSTASCTTNCLAPILQILDEAFGIEQGWMSTVHAFTNDQNHMDNAHKDLRRARACTQSIIPTSTGVGKALAGVLPHLASKIQGISLRVPTQDVSLVDLTASVSRAVTKEEVKDAIVKAAAGKLASVVAYNELPLVSSDYIGDGKSAVIDGLSLMAAGNQIKLLAWYDNEWAYASRVIDFAEYVAKAEKGSVELQWSEAVTM